MRAAGNTRPRGFYIGWLAHDNLGDAAMFAACRRVFNDISWNVVELSGRRHRFHRAGLIQKPWWWKRQQEYGLLGGGTLINRDAENLKTYVDLSKHLRTFTPVFGTGVASPEFWLGRADWRDRRSEWVKVLKDLPVVGVRGPESQRLLEEAGSLNAVVAGDPAILFRRELDTARAQHGVIGVNIGTSHGNMWGSEEGIHEFSIRCLSGLLDRGYFNKGSACLAR